MPPAGSAEPPVHEGPRGGPSQAVSCRGDRSCPSKVRKTLVQPLCTSALGKLATCQKASITPGPQGRNAGARRHGQGHDLQGVEGYGHTGTGRFSGGVHPTDREDATAKRRIGRPCLGHSNCTDLVPCAAAGAAPAEGAGTAVVAARHTTTAARRRRGANAYRNIGAPCGQPCTNDGLLGPSLRRDEEAVAQRGAWARLAGARRAMTVTAAVTSGRAGPRA